MPNLTDETKSPIQKEISLERVREMSFQRKKLKSGDNLKKNIANTIFLV